MMSNERLAQQMNFIIEIDRMKNIFRRTYVLESLRRENDAEHSWHLAVMALLLGEHAAEPGVDLIRVLKMVLVHDIVEIDAGDTYCYDAAGNQDRCERERCAADRIFALLPGEQGAEMRALWEEFEARQTREARFAGALDCAQPLLLNYLTKGKSWREHGIRKAQVLKRNEYVRDGAPALWEYTLVLIEDAVKKGYLSE